MKFNRSALLLFEKVYRDEIENNSSIRQSIAGLSGVNQYSIELSDVSGSSVESRLIVAHDMRSLIKSCETLAFLVRDAAHITPHNFASCVHTIRTFVVASVDGGELYNQNVVTLCTVKDREQYSERNTDIETTRH